MSGFSRIWGPDETRDAAVGDGAIQKVFIEPEKEGDPFEVSDADTMLEFLNPDAEKDLQKHAVIFTKPGCPSCARSKKLLGPKNFHYVEIEQGKNITSDALHAVSGSRTWPQAFIDGRLIGGEKQLKEFLA